MMAYWSWIFLIGLNLFNVEAKPTTSKLPKLLVVSYDGFRYDFFDRKEASYMKKLKESGTHADYMINSFVTKTFPNHQTIATGLYVESHGVTDSEVWDPKANKTYKYSYELYHSRDDIYPIWTLNELAGGRSGVEMWPGSHFEYNGTTSTFVTKWNPSVSNKQRIDEILSWFVHPKTPINFGMIYIEEPDYIEHGYGYEHERFNQKLKEIDDTTKYLHSQIKEKGLTDLNVVQVSDHGMAVVTTNDIVNLTDFVSAQDYTFVGLSPVMHIYPKPGKEDLVYKNLKKGADLTKKFDVYLKNEIPERYHFSNNPRIGPILLVAKIGYSFDTLYIDFDWYEKEYNMTIDENTKFGLHGYDNQAPEMHPFFFGVGPAFSPKCKVPPFENVNLVPLFCNILGIPCSKNNGTLGEFPKCLSKRNPEVFMV